jgi:hypothetical protein
MRHPFEPRVIHVQGVPFRVAAIRDGGTLHVCLTPTGEGRAAHVVVCRIRDGYGRCSCERWRVSPGGCCAHLGALDVYGLVELRQHRPRRGGPGYAV